MEALDKNKNTNFQSIKPKFVNRIKQKNSPRHQFLSKLVKIWVSLFYPYFDPTLLIGCSYKIIVMLWIEILVIYVYLKILKAMILLDIFVAMAPVAAYYSQLQLIKKEKSLGTFSIDVCAILLISGILRIFFWFAHGYAFNLLIQAVCVILIQVFNQLFLACSPQIMHISDSTRKPRAIKFLEMENLWSIQ